MGRKTETTLTLRVKVKLPPNINGQQIMEYVRQALTEGPVGVAKTPINHLTDVTVSLLKKETTYA
jgi:hypothetical protein